MTLYILSPYSDDDGIDYDAFGRPLFRSKYNRIERKLYERALAKWYYTRKKDDPEYKDKMNANCKKWRDRHKLANDETYQRIAQRDRERSRGAYRRILAQKKNTEIHLK